jgi:hypothetical protein
MKTADEYRSLFLVPGAPHEKYYGWRLIDESPGLRVLRKSYGVASRTLILLSREGLTRLAECISYNVNAWGLSDIIIHDFDGTLFEPDSIAGFRFHKATDVERILNIATFVIDLSQEEDVLLSSMSSDYRRKVRKAMQAGVLVDVHVRPNASMLTLFENAYRKFANNRGISTFKVQTLTRMYEAGDAILLTAHREGKPTNYLHLYTAGDTAFFMYGVNPIKENNGAGQYIHWQAIRELRRRGFRWYDLGGVVGRDPEDGIFQFKQNFGGNFVPLGMEWRHTGAMMKMMLSLKRKCQKRLLKYSA